MKKESFITSQSIILLILLFFGLKKGFDIFIHIAIFLIILSMGLNIVCIYYGKKCRKKD